jgi:hypothetical protein
MIEQSPYALDLRTRLLTANLTFAMEYKCPLQQCTVCRDPTDIQMQVYDENDEEEYDCFEYEQNAHLPFKIPFCSSCNHTQQSIPELYNMMTRCLEG